MQTSRTDHDFSEIDFGDARVNKRFSKLVEQLSANAGQSIQLACEDWSSVKAANRFFDNPKVDACKISEAHTATTSQRVDQILKVDPSPILILQDTTFLSYSHHPQTKGLGEQRFDLD